MVQGSFPLPQYANRKYCLRLCQFHNQLRYTPFIRCTNKNHNRYVMPLTALQSNFEFLLPCLTIQNRQFSDLSRRLSTEESKDSCWSISCLDWICCSNFPVHFFFWGGTDMSAAIVFFKESPVRLWSISGFQVIMCYILHRILASPSVTSPLIIRRVNTTGRFSWTSSSQLSLYSTISYSLLVFLFFVYSVS